MKKIFFFFIIFFLFLCSTILLAQKPLSVITTIEPLAFLIEKIGGDKVSVSVMIPSHGNPHTYEPLPSQLKDLSQADLYVQVGSGIEFELSWLDKLLSMNKKMALCNAGKNIALIPLQERKFDHEKINKDDHDHDHEGNDPHIWMSPKNVIVMTKNILDSLIAIDPGNEDFYTRNADQLIKQLTALIQEISSELSTLTYRTILVFHPAWGYFAKDFSLMQLAVESYGKEPTPKQLTEIIKETKEKNIKIIFASPQFSQKSANVIAQEIKGQVLLIDPLEKDYINNLKKAAEAFSKISYE